MLKKEESKLILSLSTLLFVIASTATFAFTLYSIKTDIDVSINSLEKNDTRIEQKFDASVSGIIIEQKEQKTIMAEIQSGQADIRASQARIETNIIWIIDELKTNN